MIRKLVLYEEVAELLTVLLRREMFRLTQGRMDLLSELPGEQTLTAQINEALCKVLCHNLCVVIQSAHELGIEPEFQFAT